MKGLSLTQPWASLIAIGEKKFETRSWPTRYRGTLVIHASKSFPRYAREFCGQEPARGALIHAGIETTHCLPLGAVIATCTLLSCVPTDCLERLADLEDAFGDFSPGRWAWLLGNVQPLATPIPWIGALSLWEVPLELGAQIAAHEAAGRLARAR